MYYAVVCSHVTLCCQRLSLMLFTCSITHFARRAAAEPSATLLNWGSHLCTCMGALSAMVWSWWSTDSPLKIWTSWQIHPYTLNTDKYTFRSSSVRLIFDRKKKEKEKKEARWQNCCIVEYSFCSVQKVNTQKKKLLSCDGFIFKKQTRKQVHLWCCIYH